MAWLQRKGSKLAFHCWPLECSNLRCFPVQLFHFCSLKGMGSVFKSWFPVFSELGGGFSFSSMCWFPLDSPWLCGALLHPQQAVKLTSRFVFYWIICHLSKQFPSSFFQNVIDTSQLLPLSFSWYLWVYSFLILTLSF